MQPRLKNTTLMSAIFTLALSSFTNCSSADTLFSTQTVLEETLPSLAKGEKRRAATLVVGPIPLDEASILDVRFQIGVSTESDRPVMIGREVRLCTRPDLVCGHQVIPALATNIDRTQHHAILEGSALFNSPYSIAHGYMTLYLWSNSSEPTSGIEIETKGAFLQVLATP